MLRGEPTLRDPGGEGRLCLLMLSAEKDAEIAFYPDSGKIGVFGEGLRKILREDAEVEYFEGEE